MTDHLGNFPLNRGCHPAEDTLSTQSLPYPQKLVHLQKAKLVDLGLYALSHSHWHMVLAITRLIARGRCAMSSVWKRVNRAHRCPICGKPDWCRVSDDGQWAICRRLDTGDGRRKVDKAGMEYWIYHLHHDANPRPLPPMPLSKATVARATDDVLHQVYQALLQSLSLAPQHQDQLVHRGPAGASVQKPTV